MAGRKDSVKEKKSKRKRSTEDEEEVQEPKQPTLSYEDQLDQMFKDRYTELDEDYMDLVRKPLPPPPCIYPWRGGGGSGGGGHGGGRGDGRGDAGYHRGGGGWGGRGGGQGWHGNYGGSGQGNYGYLQHRY